MVRDFRVNGEGARCRGGAAEHSARAQAQPGRKRRVRGPGIGTVAAGRGIRHARIGDTDSPVRQRGRGRHDSRPGDVEGEGHRGRLHRGRAVGHGDRRVECSPCGGGTADHPGGGVDGEARGQADDRPRVGGGAVVGGNGCRERPSNGPELHAIAPRPRRDQLQRSPGRRRRRRRARAVQGERDRPASLDRAGEHQGLVAGEVIRGRGELIAR
jgi:hypothetical protein